MEQEMQIFLTYLVSKTAILEQVNNEDCSVEFKSKAEV